MTFLTLFLVVAIVVLLIVVATYITKDVNTLSGLSSGKLMQQFAPSSLATSATSSGNSTNFTYSIWFFIDDWNYRYGEPKVLFGRMTNGNGQKEPCPSATFGAVENNLILSLAVYPHLEEASEEDAETVINDNSNTNFIIHNCNIANIPLQRWCNVLISVNGRTLDVYLDGKLVRTNVLPGVAKIDADAPVYVTPLGGFSGWTSYFQYWPTPTDPQEAWNIYKHGYGGSWLGNLFGKYSIKLSLMEGDTETKSVTL